MLFNLYIQNVSSKNMLVYNIVLTISQFDLLYQRTCLKKGSMPNEKDILISGMKNSLIRVLVVKLT